MSGIRHGTRLDQLKALLHTTTVQIEHARRNSRPHGHLDYLAERLQAEIDPLQAAEVAVRLRAAVADSAAKIDRSGQYVAYDVYERHHVSPAQVRAWAVEQGHPVKQSRGRLPAAVLAAYDAAHQHQETP